MASRRPRVFFRDRLDRLYCRKYGQRKLPPSSKWLAELIRTSRQTVQNWKSDETKAPKSVWALIETLEEKQELEELVVKLTEANERAFSEERIRQFRHLFMELARDYTRELEGLEEWVTGRGEEIEKLRVVGGTR